VVPHRGEDIRQSAQEKAERIVQEELGRLGWSVQDLAGRPKGDPRKLRIAGRLRKETTMTLAWIAVTLPVDAWQAAHPPLAQPFPAGRGLRRSLAGYSP
jgi:hypothetical protein